MSQEFENAIYNFNRQIGSYKQTIRDYERQIKRLEDEVDKLNKTKKQSETAESEFDSAVTATSKKLTHIAMPGGVFAAVKSTFFSQFQDVTEGAEHKKAKSAFASAIEKINQKIRSNNKQADELRAEIRRLNSSIASLNSQKNNYIATYEEPEAK